jgi:hypothetical protein
MSPLTVNLSASNIAVVDRNRINWSGFYKTSREAEADYERQLAIILKTNNIIEKRMKFVNRHFHGYFLYRFNVIVTPITS